MSFSRRDFIRTMIVSSGVMVTSWDDVLAMRTGRIPAGLGTLNHKTAHVLLRDNGTMPLIASPVRSVDTIIVGGGMSGLAA